MAASSWSEPLGKPRNLDIGAIQAGVAEVAFERSPSPPVVFEGCIEGQGFLFSKPLPVGRVPEMIERVHQLGRQLEQRETARA